MARQTVIYSDGGGERASTAAGACIIDGPKGRLQLIVFLGGATNNEAEIIAGLLAFSGLQALGVKGSVRWVCDSEYVLKSATQYIHNWQRNGWKTASKKPVKNQGLWRTYLALSEDYSVTADHVYGHTGHDENEACDSAATWARNHAYTELARQDDGMLITSVGRGDDIGWFLLDGRDFLKALRSLKETEPAAQLVQSLVEKIEELPEAGSAPKSSAAKQSSKKQLPELLASLEELQAIADEIEDVVDESTAASALHKDLLKLLKKHGG